MYRLFLQRLAFVPVTPPIPFPYMYYFFAKADSNQNRWWCCHFCGEATVSARVSTHMQWRVRASHTCGTALLQFMGFFFHGVALPPLISFREGGKTHWSFTQFWSVLCLSDTSCARADFFFLEFFYRTFSPDIFVPSALYCFNESL